MSNDMVTVRELAELVASEARLQARVAELETGLRAIVHGLRWEDELRSYVLIRDEDYVKAKGVLG